GHAREARARDGRHAPLADPDLPRARELAGARVLAEPGWQTHALATLGWLEKTCFAGDTAVVLHRVPRDGRSRDLYLGDYAALGRAFLEADLTTGQPRYLARAAAVAAALLTEFHDPRSGALLDARRDSLVNRAFWPEQPLEDLGGLSPTATALGVLADLARRTGAAREEQSARDGFRCAVPAAAAEPLAAAGYHLALAEWFPGDAGCKT